MPAKPAKPAKPARPENHAEHDNHAGKSFVLATFEGGGSVPPMIGVAEKLVARGHRVRVMSDACNREEAEAAGATFVPWKRAPSKPHKSREFDTFDDWSQANPADGFLNLMQNLLVGPALAFARDVIEELDREPADLVLSSEMLFGVPLGCEAVGQRVALLGVNIPLFPMPGFLPLGPGLTPARNAEEAALHAQAERLGLGGRVTWLPFVAPAARYLRALDVYVLSSSWEAFPIGPLEAQACGVPQVVSAVGGTPESVVPETGILVPPREPGPLADALIELLRDPERRAAMGEASRRRHAERFTVEQMVAGTAAVYAGLLT